MAKLALEPVTDMLKRIAGPLADEIGESLGVVARHYRFRLGLKMLQKTQRMFRDAGVTPQAVPPRLFLPILENASIQDDEDLHTRWAALLANAATSPNLVHPSYIEILRQLAPEDAVLLDKLYDHCKSKRYRQVTPWIDVITYGEREARNAAGEHPEVPFRNLVRLGLIEVVYELDDRKIKVKVVPRDSRADISAELDDHYVFTDIAMAFVQACRAPNTIDAEQSTLNDK